MVMKTIFPPCLLLFVSFAVGGEDFVPNGVYDLSPRDLDELCKMVDPSYVPMANSEPCVYMKWVQCASGGTRTQPCGWYQQSYCEKSREKRQWNNSTRSRRHNAPQRPVMITWPQTE